LKFNKNPKTKQISSLIDYEDFCSSSRSEKPIKEISAAKLKSILAEKYDEWQIIDVREPYEYHKGNIGGVSVPLAEIDNLTDKVKPNKKAVLVCRSGTRSIKAIRKLEKKGFTNLYNLKGGLIEWVKNIDQGLPLA
jgi:sulfur-carrier protein adenylyltransferase/sulfurtransferase